MKLTAISPDEATLVVYEWTVNGAIIGENTRIIDIDVASPDVVSVKGQNDCGSWSLPIELVWGDPVENEYIGEIIYEFKDDLFGDEEIKFTVPINNVSNEEKCFFIDLRDKNGVFLEKAPMLLQTLRLGAGESGSIIVDSYGAVNPSWGLSNVIDSIVKFELKSVNTVFGVCSLPPIGYDIIESKTLSVTKKDEEPDERPIMPDDYITPEENLKIINSAYPSEVAYNDIFTMKFGIQNLNAVFAVNTIARLFDKTSGSFITERKFKIEAGKTHVLDLPGYMYTTNHLHYRLVIYQDKIWPIPNELEDALDFSVLNSGYIDPTDPDLVLCEQHFKITYDKVAVPGTVVVDNTEVPISVEGGMINLFKGKTYIATAYHSSEKETKTFTSCTLEPLVFGLETPPDPDDVDSNMLLYLAVFAMAVMMFKGA